MKIIFINNKCHKNVYEIVVSKKLLISYSRFFKSMLTSYREKHNKIINVYVDNPAIAYDVINELLGVKSNILLLDDSIHYLVSVKMKTYLMIEYEQIIPLDFKISPEYYNLLIDIVGYHITNDQAVQVLINNLPLDINKIHLSKHLLTKLMN